MLRAAFLPSTFFLVAVGALLGGPSAGGSRWKLAPSMEIEVTGEDFGWSVRYPGPDGVLHTGDDRFGSRDVHVPAGSHATLHLRSLDYVYTLELPHLGLKEIAVPDLEFAIEFDADREGRHALRGSQMCGAVHPGLIGTLFVESPREFFEAVSARAH